jgi:hypothetical protein
MSCLLSRDLLSRESRSADLRFSNFRIVMVPRSVARLA